VGDEAGESSKILVVDDVPENVELLASMLEGKGYRVVTTTNGEEALEKVAHDQPDLILLDIMMPGTDGFEVCRRLKADPKTESIPIIMVTVLDELEDIEKGVEVGTDDFLTKPVNRLELLTRVKSLLRVRHLKTELERTLAYLSSLEKQDDDA